ncbi:YbjN domain-containing protein [Micromonospora echinospora]|uniref:YbjN domain-containing protein n=1 Tax=Micromonospora echinospora TaxID=1877 RepID=UPI00340D1F5A
MSGGTWRESLDAARDLPDGEAKVAELERIAAHADAAGEVRLGVDARLALVETHRFRGERWRSVEPLHRCLAAVDRHPALFDAEDTAALLRGQHAAVEALSGSPRIGLDQARYLLDDLDRRLAGAEPGTVAELRCRLADHLGDEPAARAWFARWRAAGPGHRCAACVAVRQAELLTGWGEWAEAVRVLEPLTTDPGDCTDQPEAALAALLLPYLRLGRYDDAGRAHVRAYRRHRREWTAFGHLPAHLLFCALGGHPARGLEILVEQLPRLARPTDERSVMEFAAAGALLCRLAGESGLVRTPDPTGQPDETEPDAAGPHRSTGPAGHPGPARRGHESWPVDALGLGHATRLAEVFGLLRPAGSAGGRDIAALGAELLATAADLAGRFDARNGTGHQSGQVAARLAERPRTGVPAPLPVGPAPDDAGAGPVDAEPDGPGSPGEPVPLTVAMVVAALERRGDRCAVDPAGAVVGRWGEAMIRFERVGSRAEILHTRVVATRRLSAGRRAEAYEFVNAWNRDRLQPKAYVHEVENELVLAGDLTTDLAHGVAPVQVEVLVDAAVTTGVAYAEAVAALP